MMMKTSEWAYGPPNKIVRFLRQRLNWVFLWPWPSAMAGACRRNASRPTSRLKKLGSIALGAPFAATPAAGANHHKYI
jgi:hypothetical protein